MAGTRCPADYSPGKVGAAQPPASSAAVPGPCGSLPAAPGFPSGPTPPLGERRGSEMWERRRVTRSVFDCIYSGGLKKFLGRF